MILGFRRGSRRGGNGDFGAVGMCNGMGTGQTTVEKRG